MVNLGHLCFWSTGKYFGWYRQEGGPLMFNVDVTGAENIISVTFLSFSGVILVAAGIELGLFVAEKLIKLFLMLFR